MSDDHFPTAAHPAESRLSFTTTQAAHYVGVSLGTIRRWADAGHVQCYRTPGGQRRFSREQLDSFLASLEPAAQETHQLVAR
jgi:excisionase family DNA binding protein